MKLIRNSRQSFDYRKKSFLNSDPYLGKISNRKNICYLFILFFHYQIFWKSFFSKSSSGDNQPSKPGSSIWKKISFSKFEDLTNKQSKLPPRETEKIESETVGTELVTASGEINQSRDQTDFLQLSDVVDQNDQMAVESDSKQTCLWAFLWWRSTEDSPHIDGHLVPVPSTYLCT